MSWWLLAQLTSLLDCTVNEAKIILCAFGHVQSEGMRVPEANRISDLLRSSVGAAEESGLQRHLHALRLFARFRGARGWRVLSSHCRTWSSPRSCFRVSSAVSRRHCLVVGIVSRRLRLVGVWQQRRQHRRLQGPKRRALRSQKRPSAGERLEAATGVEPVMEVLQTSDGDDGL